MNVTHIFGEYPVLIGETIKAREYFIAKYPNIRYNNTTDSFILNGVEFDYYKSANCLEDGKQRTYILVDKKYPHVWLFEMRPTIEGWERYLATIVENKNKRRLTVGSWIMRFLRRMYWAAS